MNLLIKLPSRERRVRFFDVLNKAQKNRELESTRFLITLDSNDGHMNNSEVRNTLGMWGNVQFEYGVSNNKIHAVNRDMEKAPEFDVLLLLSDDMMPEKKGYDKIICDLFEKQFPDTDGVLWMNDGFVGTRLNTSVCVGRKWFERFGYLYHPSYISLFADNELTDVSLMLNKFHYVHEVLVRHIHPMNVGGAQDNLYRKNDRFFQMDKRNYEKRKLIDFDLKLEQLQVA